MIDRWNVFNKLRYAGVLEYYEQSKKFYFDQKEFTSDANNAVDWLNLNRESDLIKETILYCRIFPPGRMNASDILRDLGLNEYDAWEIVKATNLINVCDCVWMTKGSDPYEFFDLHPTAKWLAKQGLLSQDLDFYAGNSATYA